MKVRTLPSAIVSRSPSMPPSACAPSQYTPLSVRPTSSAPMVTVKEKVSPGSMPPMSSKLPGVRSRAPMIAEPGSEEAARSSCWVVIGASPRTG